MKEFIILLGCFCFAIALFFDAIIVVRIFARKKIFCDKVSFFSKIENFYIRKTLKWLFYDRFIDSKNYEIILFFGIVEIIYSILIVVLYFVIIS